MPPHGGVRGYRAAVALLAGVALLVGCGAGEEHVFSEAASPDGAWVLRITVAESRMPQGPFHVGAYLIPAAAGAAPVQVLETTLVNDGVPFTARNVSARWTGKSTALLCLRASDRPDRGWRVEAGPPPRAVAGDAC